MLLFSSIFSLAIFSLNIKDIACAIEVENGLQWYNEGDEECVLSKETERIQIGIAADVTGTNIANVKEAFASRTTEIVEAVNSIHDGTEFAITIHANWEQGAFGRAPHRDPEGCYTRKLNFTTNVKLIADVAKTLEKNQGPDYPDGRQEENGLSAVAFTVADSTLGWIREDVDKAGKRMHRFILLFTDQFSIFSLLRPGNRTDFKGDGTDTCSTSLPPTEDIVGRLLKREKIIVIGVYVQIAYKPFWEYISFFQKYEIPHVPQHFPNITYLKQEIVKFIRDTVKNQLKCVFEDPPAYNTLGL